MTTTTDLMRRRLAPVLLSIATAAAALAGCAITATPAPSASPDTKTNPARTAGPNPSSPGGATAPSPTLTAASPAAPESNPPGDIPDNQVYVAYRPPGAAWQVKVPEGWARSTSGDTVTFTDKLNAVNIINTKTPTAPTAADVTAAVNGADGGRPGFTWGRVDSVKRSAGTAYRTMYRVDAAADPVTGKTVNDDVETYTFWRNGQQVTLRLSGPHGADNVDPWKIITDSFRWQK